LTNSKGAPLEEIIFPDNFCWARRSAEPKRKNIPPRKNLSALGDRQRFKLKEKLLQRTSR
jgi:hypothetical protein